MPNNYILLETIALTQSAASVTFDNLPTSGYTDLKIVISVRGPVSYASNTMDTYIRFNGTTTNYSDRLLYGTGSSALSLSETPTGINVRVNGESSTASTFGNAEIYIPNYTSSNNKSVSIDAVTENNGTAVLTQLVAGLWSNTAAITSISFIPFTTGFAAGSTFSLYGIAALGTTPVLAPKATGGNIVANDGTYWYHAFTSSGNFVPQTGLTADVLVVAGGGGGGSLDGGGGGAGGLTYYASQSLTAINYTCTVGAGGTGATTSTATQGINSQFAALTASVGGGLGGGFNGTSAAGGIGGSGGGGGYDNASGGVGTSGQGNNGGSGFVVPSVKAAGGGGGGFGATGTSATSSAAGNGGIGSSTYSSWLSATTLGVSGYIAAGGGGGGDNRGTTAGTGGTGGGGAGSVSATATAGQSGTGSGGGGGGYNGSTQNGGAGGSGIIIIRYPVN